MKAIVIEEFGAASNMRLKTAPTPTPNDDEVLVRVHATSVNPVDIQTRRGDYASEIKLPARLGVDISGVVENVGSNVENLSIGDEVFYVPRLLQNEGGYASHHVEKACLLAKKPKNLSHLESAALPLACGTAWECLVERGRIQAGDKVLIHGGAGGVGVYALQIARMFGAYAITTCSEGSIDFVKSLGAEGVYDYRKDNVYERIQNDHPGGFDIILDTVGQKTIELSLGLLANKGKVISIVDQSQPQNLFSGWPVNGEIHFVFTTQSSIRLSKLAAAVEAGHLSPVIEKHMKLDDIAEAHQLIESGGRKGKIVIEID
ncbi:zinc-binding dehydrogenase [Hahella chejuensis]|nr:zinc-binding dehydrogenase [Hahella chejuensis]